MVLLTKAVGVVCTALVFGLELFGCVVLLGTGWASGLVWSDRILKQHGGNYPARSNPKSQQPNTHVCVVVLCSAAQAVTLNQAYQPGAGDLSGRAYTHSDPNAVRTRASNVSI